MIGLPEATAHGGALDAAIAAYGGERSSWLDLSTGINPVPPPLPDFAPELWTRLPGRRLEHAALTAAAAFYGTGPECGLVSAPGSQALISLVPHLFPPAEAAVLEPSYSEHRKALTAAGHRVSGFGDLRSVPGDARLVVVVNPNNPDGRVFPRAALLELGERLARSGGWLIVDEAFMDCDPAESLAPEAGREGLLVHRSFGKFFGYGGLRLGFALTSRAMAARLDQRLGPWPVSGPALAAAAAMLGDAALVQRLRAEIQAQVALREAAIAGAGLQSAGGTALFGLIRHERAGRLFAALCRRRLLTRPFAYRADWLRIGNPASRRDAERLEATLREALAEVGAT